MVVGEPRAVASLAETIVCRLAHHDREFCRRPPLRHQRRCFVRIGHSSSTASVDIEVFVSGNQPHIAPPRQSYFVPAFSMHNRRFGIGVGFSSTVSTASPSAARNSQRVLRGSLFTFCIDTRRSQRGNLPRRAFPRTTGRPRNGVSGASSTLNQGWLAHRLDVAECIFVGPRCRPVLSQILTGS